MVLWQHGPPEASPKIDESYHRVTGKGGQRQSISHVFEAELHPEICSGATENSDSQKTDWFQELQTRNGLSHTLIISQTPSSGESVLYAQNGVRKKFLG